jgi:hypothetical protein
MNCGANCDSPSCLQHRALLVRNLDSSMRLPRKFKLTRLVKPTALYIVDLIPSQHEIRKIDQPASDVGSATWFLNKSSLAAHEGS